MVDGRCADMAETVAQFRSSLTPTTDGCVDTGCDVSMDHVTGNDEMSDGRLSPVIAHARRESSGSASLSSCSSHETVVSVGVRQPETRDEPSRDADRNPQPETVCCNGDQLTESGVEVFNSEMTVMSPLVNRWRRRQQAEAENISTSGPYLGWNNTSGSGLRSDASSTETNIESRRGRSGHGYSSDTEAFLRTLGRRGTASGQPVTVSGRCTGQSPSVEYPAWLHDRTANLYKTGSPSSVNSPVKPLEVRIYGL